MKSRDRGIDTSSPINTKPVEWTPGCCSCHSDDKRPVRRPTFPFPESNWAPQLHVRDDLVYMFQLAPEWAKGSKKQKQNIAVSLMHPLSLKLRILNIKLFLKELWTKGKRAPNATVTNSYLWSWVRISCGMGTLWHSGCDIRTAFVPLLNCPWASTLDTLNENSKRASLKRKTQITATGTSGPAWRELSLHTLFSFHCVRGREQGPAPH